MTRKEIDELKDFVQVTVVASENRLGARIDKLETRVDRLEAKVDNGFAGIAEALDAIIAHVDAANALTNRRLTRLERHVFGKA